MGDLKSAFAITQAEREAMAAGKDVPAVDNGQNHLYAPSGHTLTQNTDTNRSGLASLEQPQLHNASLAGDAGVHPADRRGMMNTTQADGTPRHPQATRPPTDDELLARANEMLDNQRENSHTLLGQGASTGPRDDAGGATPKWLHDYMGDQ